MQTCVRIEGLELYAFHGLYAEERSLGQKFLFGLRASLEPSETHADDILAQSVGYDMLVDEVTRISALSPFGTLEALAETIGRQLLEKYTILLKLEVTVAKVSPPIRQHIGLVEVSVSLDRGDISIKK